MILFLLFTTLQGADSSMLVPGVCCASTAALLDNADEYKGEENVGDDWELGMCYLLF